MEVPMSDNHDQIRVLAPQATKPKLDRLQRLVEDAAGHPLSRRSALGLGGLMLLSACGGTTTGGATANAPSQSSSGDALAGKPLENHLEIYNWSEYDDPSTYKKFKALPAEQQAGLSIHETYYSSNDELLAKLHAGGSQYDIIVPSQNAVAQLIQEGQLMKLDPALLPNLKNLDPHYVKASYDPTGEYHVIKDYGITMIFYNNQIITEQPKTMLDFYHLLTKYGSKGRTNLLDGAEEVVPLALMALGIDPNTDNKSDFDEVTKFLNSVAKGVTTVSSYGYIDDAIAGKIILSQGWNGDVRRIVQGRKKEGDITPVLLEGASEIWADNWCIPSYGAPPRRRARLDQLAADPVHRGDRDGVPQLRHPDPDRAVAAAGLAEERPAVQRPEEVHRQLPLHPQCQPAGGADAHPDLHAVQSGDVMADAGDYPVRVEKPARSSKRRSFSPRYPVWLTSGSFVYYAIFFLGPLALLVAFSLATQTGFTTLSYGFDTSQYHLVVGSLYLKIFERTLVMAAVGSVLTMIVGYPLAYWMARYLSTYKMLALRAGPRALLDVVPDPHLRAEDHPRLPRVPGQVPRDQHHVHQVRRGRRAGLQLPAAVHHPGVRVPGADGLVADRGSRRPRGHARSTRSGRSRCG